MHNHTLNHIVRNVALHIILGLSLVVATPSAQAGPSATEQMKGTVDQILHVLSDKGLAKEARREALTKLIMDRFDFRSMSQMTLATNWKGASDEQKQKFVSLYSQLLQESYMSRIESYTDEKIEFGAEKIKNDKAMVDSKIITKTVEIPVNYKLVLNGDVWQVYDVVIEEISLIRSFRSDYDDVVRKEGMDGLLAKMQQKITDLKNKPAVAKG